LDSNYYPDQKLLIRSNSPERNAFIKSIQLDGNEFEKSFITHEQLINSKEFKFILHQKPVK
jgi:putative alpha-1,2-mannosidase